MVKDLKLFIASVMFHEQGWMLHYAWGYNAETIESAAEAAYEHFQLTHPESHLASIHITDGVMMLVTRRNPVTGRLLGQVTKIGESKLGSEMPGPASEVLQ